MNVLDIDSDGNKEIVYLGNREDGRNRNSSWKDVNYIFDLNTKNSKSPLLNIYGGKLTTYRKLSEKVIEELSPYLPNTKTKSWTATKQL